MAIDFPNSPSSGDIYTVNGKQWSWDGAKWLAYGVSLAPDILKVDTGNNRVGINQTSPTVALDVTGSARITGDLTVSGTTVTVDLASVLVKDRIVFEGSSADDYETTLIVTNPTGADKTITLPNADGTVAFIASPTFTGTPLAPTASANTSSTQIATTAFVMTEVGDYLTTATASSTYAPKASPVFTGNVTMQSLDMDTLVAGDVMYASGADTLARLAKGSDTHVLTLASGAPSWAAPAAAANITAVANNSTDETVYPTFVDGATGTQGIETDTGLTYNPSTGTLTSTIFAGAATTAGTVTTAAQGAITSVGTLSTLAVTGAVTAGSLVAPIEIPTAKTASYTLVIGDAGKLIEMNVGSGNTLTIPTNTVDFDVGTQIVIVQLGAGATTIAGAGSVAIYSKDSNKIIDGQYSAVTLIKRADTSDGQWHLIGALA